MYVFLAIETLGNSDMLEMDKYREADASRSPFFEPRGSAGASPSHLQIDLLFAGDREEVFELLAGEAGFEAVEAEAL